MSPAALPLSLYSGVWHAGHVQGAAIDTDRRYVYYSFTDILVKTTLQGQVVGSVTGLVGHMGCLAYNPRDGRVYASLEYKADIIGRQISQRLGLPPPSENGFYIAIFDVDKITRPGMDATRDGVMTCVHLPEVLQDYSAQWLDAAGNPRQHRHGCSGIDGLTFAPAFGGQPSGWYLYVAYGIYSDTTRTDNDHQVLLRYNTAAWAQYERPLTQDKLHRSGPAAPDEKIFVYTGNTTYGIQNLEYDPFTASLLAAVYKGVKPSFPNYSLFAIDLAQPTHPQALAGTETSGHTAALLKQGLCDTPTGLHGWQSPLGSTGLISLGQGFYYLSQPSQQEGGHVSRLLLHRWTGRTPCPFQLLSR